MENYFNYFTEIEEHFRQRRGGGLLLSTLDWALIETWKDAGVPLDAALRGIDAAFDRYDERPSKSRKVNSLAYCAQEVLAAAEDMKEAAAGALSAGPAKRSTGFEPPEIANFLCRTAAKLEAIKVPEAAIQALTHSTAATLRDLATKIQNVKLEDLERHLTVLEEKLFAILLATTPDEEIVSARAEADRELMPYRSKMTAPQIDQLQKQFTHKRLLEKHGIPRLSLFYM